MAKVLIIDDEENFRDTLCKYASRLGHEVESAGDAITALKSGRMMTPDVIFVDWMLKSELNGLDVIQMLRERAPELIAVVITGDLALELPSRLEEAGRTSILRKPFGLLDFKAALDDAVLMHSIKR